VICGQGFLPLALDEPTSNCKVAVVCTLDRGPHSVLSTGPAEPRFFNEVVTPHPHPFPTWLGTDLGGTLNTQQANKLLANEMDFWRRSARKSSKEKVRNGTIRTIMEVRKNILEVIEEKRLQWFRHVNRMPGNRLPLKILEWQPEGTRRRGRPKDIWSKTEHDKPWTDRR
jgi:hypothetical protein